MMSLNVRVFPSRSSVMNIPLSGAAAAVFLVAAVAAGFISTPSVEAAFAAVAVGSFCVCLMIVPTFWMAVVLVVLIPFQTLISELLGRYGSNARQVFAAWKVVLLLIGIFRVLRNNPNRRQIMVANRWVLSWSGLLGWEEHTSELQSLRHIVV